MEEIIGDLVGEPMTFENIEAMRNNGAFFGALQSIATYNGIESNGILESDLRILLVQNHCLWESVSKTGKANKEARVVRKVQTNSGGGRGRKTDEGVLRLQVNIQEFSERSKFHIWYSQFVDGLFTEGTVKRVGEITYTEPNWKRIDPSFMNKAYVARYDSLDVRGKGRFSKIIYLIRNYFEKNLRNRNFSKDMVARGDVDYLWHISFWANFAIR